MQRKRTALCATLVCLTGCGGGSSSGTYANISPFQTTSGQFRGVRFTLTTRKIFRSRENVPLEMTIENPTTEPITIISSSWYPDVAVETKGRAVWSLHQWFFAHFTPTSERKELTLQPGEKATYESSAWGTQWNQTDQSDAPVSRGVYSLRAFLPLSHYNGERLPADEAKAFLSDPIEIIIQ